MALASVLRPRVIGEDFILLSEEQPICADRFRRRSRSMQMIGIGNDVDCLVTLECEIMMSLMSLMLSSLMIPKT